MFRICCCGNMPRVSALRDLHHISAGAVLLIFLATSNAHSAESTSSSGTQASQVGLEEIVVTAERRSVDLQRLAAPVSVLTAEDLKNAGVTSQYDVTRLVPSVSIISAGQNSTQTYVRGVGALSGNTYAEQAVAFNLDGVYLARGEAITGHFYDLDRIEVLKGPQGTLYGRNTTSGAVNIITAKPKLDVFGGNVQAEFGNYGRTTFEGALNLPLGDRAAVRVAGQRLYHQGYLSDGYDDQDEVGGRAMVLWTPTDNLTLRIGGDYSHDAGKGEAPVLAPIRGNFWDGPSSPSQASRWIAVGANPLPSNGYIRVNATSVTGQLDWTTSAGTLTVLPALVESHEDALHLGAGFPVQFTQRSKSDSLEARFASPGGERFSYIVGAYYFKEDAGFTLFANQTSFGARNQVPAIDTTSKAVFGEGTIKLTDDLRLVLGTRYTKEDKSTTGETKAAPLVILDTVPFTPFNNSLNANKSTWKAGFEYDVNPTSLLYLTASTGFKAGGFFVSPGGTYKPETLTSITAGSKNRFLDNRLQVNLEAYHWSYKDKQVSHLGFLPNGAIDLVTENAGNATMYGIEPEVVFLISPKDRFSTTLAWEHAVYDHFIYTTVPPGPTGGTCPASATGRFTPGGVPIFQIDCSGFNIPNAPKLVVTAAYSHTFDLPNGGDIEGELSAHYRGSTISGEEQTASEHDPAFTTEDFTLTYNHPGDSWSLTAWVYNLSDAHGLLSSFYFDGAPGFAGAPGIAPVAGVGSLGPMTNQYPPRTYGLRLSAKF